MLPARATVLQLISAMDHRQFTLTNTPEALNGEFRSRVDDNAIRLKLEGKNIYQIRFRNVGGLVTPLVIEWTYKDGSKEIETNSCRSVEGK